MIVMSTGVSESLSTFTSTAISTVACAFPPARDHIRAVEIRAATDTFFLEAWLFASQKERDLFMRSDFGSFTSKCARPLFVGRSL